MSKILDVSWSDYLDMVHTLAGCIKRKKPSLLVGKARGGAILVSMLSHVLDDVPCYIVNKSPYEDFGLSNVKNYILVDDIVDTGVTVDELLHVVSSEPLLVASLFVKPKGLTRVSNYVTVQYVREIKDSVWVKFPYEMRAK